MSTAAAEASAFDVKLYTLEEAAERCGFPSAGALRTFLCRNRDFAAPRYAARGFRSVRMVTQYEVDALRRNRVK